MIKQCGNWPSKYWFIDGSLASNHSLAKSSLQFIILPCNRSVVMRSDYYWHHIETYILLSSLHCYYYRLYSNVDDGLVL